MTAIIVTLLVKTPENSISSLGVAHAHMLLSLAWKMVSSRNINFLLSVKLCCSPETNSFASPSLFCNILSWVKVQPPSMVSSWFCSGCRISVDGNQSPFILSAPRTTCIVGWCWGGLAIAVLPDWLPNHEVRPQDLALCNMLFAVPLPEVLPSSPSSRPVRHSEVDRKSFFKFRSSTCSTAKHLSSAANRYIYKWTWSYLSCSPWMSDTSCRQPTARSWFLLSLETSVLVSSSSTHSWSLPRNLHAECLSPLPETAPGLCQVCLLLLRLIFIRFISAVNTFHIFHLMFFPLFLLQTFFLDHLPLAVPIY